MNQNTLLGSDFVKHYVDHVALRVPRSFDGNCYML